MSSWLWETMQFTDVIDILILAYILYRTLLIIRGTRAVQSLVGLLFLVVLYAISARVGLTSINWMLEKFFVYIVIAILILFQNDIRRGLARAGRLFPQFRSDGDLAMLQEVIKASFAMGSRRVGSLIAIERGASLDDFVEPATQIDAVVSEDLLLSIFHHTSPLHDGAVVIQKGRIAAAQVFVPLTLSKNVSRFYGSRHLAAIGLTEDTDAVVVVVSEQRGVVSLALEGKITPMPDANTLRQRLLELFQDEPSEPVSEG